MGAGSEVANTAAGALSGSLNPFQTFTPSLSGGDAGPAISNPLYSGRNAINVAPTAVNLGGIISPFVGPPENGGMGLTGINRFASASKIGFSISPDGASVEAGSGTLLLLGVGAVALFLIMKGRK